MYFKDQIKFFFLIHENSCIFTNIKQTLDLESQDLIYHPNEITIIK